MLYPPADNSDFRAQEAILARGEERTRVENEKLKKNCNYNLLTFSLDSLNNAENKSEFDTKASSDRGATFHFIAPPKRERKQNYDINQYYREALRVGPKVSFHSLVP